MSRRAWQWHGTAATALGAALLAVSPAWAEVRIEKHLALAPGGRLVVDSSVGSVTARGDAASGATVVLTSDRDDLEKKYDIRFESAANEVRVTVKRRAGTGWFGDWQGDRGKTAIAISVPRATVTSVRLSGGNIDLAGLDGGSDLRSSGGNVTAASMSGKVVAESSGGDVTARSIRGDVDISSSGGNLTAEAIQGNLTAGSSGGGVHVDRIAGDVVAKSSGGDVSVKSAGGRVVAYSSGGSVRVSFAAGNGHGGEVSSSGGAVDVQVDPAAHLNIDASASGGSVDCSLPLTMHGHLSHGHVEGTLQGGGAVLKLHSSGGGVSIAAL